MRILFSLLLIVSLMFLGCVSNRNPSTSPPEGTNLSEFIRISTEKGQREPLPIADRGLTVVSLFDEFCTECPTGSRFQTVNGLKRLPHPPGKILIIFSEEHFSSDDVENFRTLLSNNALFKGNVEAVKPHLNNGKLLVVFDSNRKTVWQEKPGMSEENVLAAISELF